MQHSPNQRSRFGRWHWGRWLAMGALLVGLAVVASLVGLNTNYGREVVRNRVNSTLSGLFLGQIVIDRIGSVGLAGIAGADVRILDPQGRQVMVARQLNAQIALGSLLRSLFADDVGLQVLLPDLECEELEVVLIEDPNAGVSLAGAFEALDPESVDSQATADDAPGPRVELSRIRIAHTTLSYQQLAANGDPQTIVLDLRALAAGVQSDEWGVQVSLDSVVVSPKQWPEGVMGELQLRAGLRIPSDANSALNLDANLRGRINDALLEARAALNGEAVHGTVQVSEIHARQLARLWPDLRFDGDSLLGVNVRGILPLIDVDASLITPAGTLVTRADIALDPELEVQARVLADQIDLTQLSRDVSASRVGLEAEVYAVLDGETWLGSQWLNVPPFELEGQAIPELELWGTFSADAERQVVDMAVRGSEAGLTLWAKANARHSAGPSAPGVGTIEGGQTSAEADVSIALDRPARFASLGITGQGRVQASGKWSQAGAAHAALSAQLRRVAYKQFTAHDVALSARVVHEEAQTESSGSLAMAVAGGRIDARARAGPHVQSLQAQVRRVDLGVLTDWLERQDIGRLRGTHKPSPPISGLANVELDAQRRDGVLKGSVDLKLEDVARGKVRGDIDASVAMKGNRVDGKVRARLEGLGRVQLSLEQLVLPDDPASWTRQWPSGNVTADGNVDLAAASELLNHPIPVERLGGQLEFRVKVERAPSAKFPALAVDLKTHSLVVVEQRPVGTETGSVEAARAAEPWVIDGVDVQLSVASDATEHVLKSQLALRDRWGLLAQVDAALDLPGDAYLTQLSAWRGARRWPLQGGLTIPTRPSAQLPSMLQPGLARVLGVSTLTQSKGRNGSTLGLTASVAGTFAEPRLAVRGQVEGLGSEKGQAPLGLRLWVDADAARGSARIEAARAAGTLATVSTRWAGDLRNIGRQGVSRPVELDVDAHCNGLPLTLIPAAQFVGIKGTISGDIRVSGLGRDARLSVKLASWDLNVAGAAVSSLRVTAEVKNQQAIAQADITTSGGNLRASASSTVRWGAQWVPETGAPRQFELSARGFQLGVLRPALGRQVNEFMGRMDAELKLQQAQGTHHLGGYVRVTDGVVQVPAVGQRLSKIEAMVRVDDGHVVLERFKAAGITGEMHAKGSAELDAVQVRSARLDVEIPKGRKMPLTVEGVALGDAWGKVNVKYARAAKASQLDVTVSKFELIAPEASAGPLQSLDERSDIRIGARRADGKFASLPVQPIESDESDAAVGGSEKAPLRIHVVLGNVTVRRGTDVDARLSGVLDVIEGEVAGKIEIAGGSLDVQGKRFEIESGVVTFDGEDASNPSISATARWDSPTEHSVYAQYIGDVENGHIKLYSEPPLSQDQIASLLLFGTPDGAIGARESDQASLAVSAAGGTVAKGLNQALDEFTQLDVSARVDTSTGNPRPELVFQVSPRVATKVSRAVGEPTAGEAPDRTFVTLELRLKRFWAVSAVLGDHGASALDLVWRRRY